MTYQNIKQNLFGLLVFALFFLISPGLQAEDEVVALTGAEVGKWTMDYEAAVKVAAKEKLAMILNFTGSDWCGWCKLMDKNVFAGEAWKKYAATKVLLVTIDFPQDAARVPEGFKARNDKLKDQFGVQGFPTYVVLDSDGSTVLGQLGAGQEKTPESFIKEFEETTRFSAANVAIYTAAHPDKAADLKAAMESYKKVEGEMAAWIKTGPVQNDENNKIYTEFQKRIQAAMEKLDTFK